MSINLSKNLICRGNCPNTQIIRINQQKGKILKQTLPIQSLQEKKKKTYINKKKVLNPDRIKEFKMGNQSKRDTMATRNAV